jgi:hypothetical protein
MSEIRAPLRTGAPSALTSRAAEENDAQASVDKEDLDRHKRGKRTGVENRERLDIYEDLSEVSVALLRGFLQGLMETRDKVHEARSQSAVKPYAMQAYQSAQRAAPEAPKAPVVADDAEVMGFSRLDLATEGLDKGMIRDILTQLENMEVAGIHYIAIEKSTSFLQSIRDGINRALDETVA